MTKPDGTTAHNRRFHAPVARHRFLQPMVAGAQLPSYGPPGPTAGPARPLVIADPEFAAGRSVEGRRILRVPRRS